MVLNKHAQNEEQPKDFDLSHDHEFDHDIDEMSALENSVENQIRKVDYKKLRNYKKFQFIINYNHQNDRIRNRDDSVSSGGSCISGLSSVEKVDSIDDQNIHSGSRSIDEVSEGNELRQNQAKLGFKNQFSNIFKGIVKP